MNPKHSIYPAFTAFLFGSCSCIFGFAEASRIPEAYMEIYVALKIIYGLFGIGLGIYFLRHKASDLLLSIFMLVMVSYAITFAWLAPLYELAYLQCALGSSFFQLKRNWLFPSIYGIGFVAFIITYNIQDSIGWVIPPVTRGDWYWIMFVFFVLTWIIQKYAIGTYRKEKEQVLRYSILGQETTRLTHDIKGLLSSPMMIVDSLRSGTATNKQDLEKQINFLAEDMSHVRDAIKSLNSLVKLEDEKKDVDVLQVVSGVLKVFSRRASYIKIELPETKMVLANPDRLHSIFFNLILNSIEEFEIQKIQDPFIRMQWQDNTLIIMNNAAGGREELSSKKSHSSGIGLNLVRSDLDRIDAKLSIVFTDIGTRTEIQFSRIT